MQMKEENENALTFEMKQQPHKINQKLSVGNNNYNNGTMHTLHNAISSYNETV